MAWIYFKMLRVIKFTPCVDETLRPTVTCRNHSDRRAGAKRRWIHRYWSGASRTITLRWPVDPRYRLPHPRWESSSGAPIFRSTFRPRGGDTESPRPVMRASWWVAVIVDAVWPKNGTNTVSLTTHVWSGAYQRKPPFQVAHGRADVLVGEHRLGMRRRRTSPPTRTPVSCACNFCLKIDVVARSNRVSRVMKWPDTSSTPRPSACIRRRCSRPSICTCGRMRSMPHHARMHSSTPTPSASKLSRTRRWRQASSFSGKHSRRLTSGGATAAAEQAPADPAHATTERTLQHPRQAGDGEGADGGEHRPVAGITATDGRRWWHRTWRHLPTRQRVFPGGSRILAACAKTLPNGSLRGLYSAVLYILLPITVYHLVWRGFRSEFRRWDERYASPQPTGQPRVWLHAVSVGEVNAAAPLVNALRQQRPDIRWVITTITPTGSERVRALWGRAGPRLSAVRRAGQRQPLRPLPAQPGADPGNRAVAEHAVRLPRPPYSVYILNARLSARSLRGYRAGGADPPCAAHGHLRGRAVGTTPRASCSWGRRGNRCRPWAASSSISPRRMQGFVEQFHACVPAGRRCGSRPVPMMASRR